MDAKLHVGAQCGCAADNGGHTGDVSMTMLADSGCRYVLCGHSERRKFHGETTADVLAQAAAALQAKLIPIVCIGETENERNAGETKEIVKAQLEGLPSGSIVAYEPAWAIGTGKTPAAEDVQDIHALIRLQLGAAGAATRILYGGSMTAKNTKDFLRCPDVDGGLIGGASLKPEEFREIVEMVETIRDGRQKGEKK